MVRSPEKIKNQSFWLSSADDAKTVLVSAGKHCDEAVQWLFMNLTSVT